MNQTTTSTTEATIAAAIETQSIADLAPQTDVTGGAVCQNNLKQIALAATPPPRP